jgi:golgi apparatus protein 1
MVERAKSIDLHPEIQDKCSYDLANLCSKTKMNVKGEEIRCLQYNRNELQAECKEAIDTFTVIESKDIRLDQILMNSCLPTIEEYCTEQKDEKGALLDCLIEQKDNPKMNEKCKIGIQHHQLLNLEKVDFNFKFKKFCEKEIKEHCSKAKSKLDAVHCLSELVLNDTLLDKPQRVHSTCRKQLRFELVQLNENIKLDPELARACQSDVSNFCRDVREGKGQVLECLRSKKNELTTECRKKLFKRDEINLIEQGGDYTLKRECKNSIKLYCHEETEDDSNEVKKDDVLGCLRKRLGQPDLEPSCRTVVIERIITQNEDFRLNPVLWKSCNKDVERQCSQEFKDAQDASKSLHGRAMSCLKKLFVKDRITSKQCSLLVEETMREAALIDYRLDPLLVDNCITEIESLCADEPNDKKENCLRLKFQNRLIPRDSSCFEVSLNKRALVIDKILI